MCVSIPKMTIDFPDLTYRFAASGAGFPTVTQHLRREREGNILSDARPWMKIELSDGTVATPVWDENDMVLSRRDEEGTAFITFCNIGWQDARGCRLPDWKLTLEYELYADGVGFLEANFVTKAGVQRPVRSFKMTIPMSLENDSDVMYGCWPRPQQDEVDAAAIQGRGRFARGVTEKRTLGLEGNIPPVFGIDFGQNGKLGRHVEWMSEDQPALDNNPRHVSAFLTWHDGDPVLEYEFATCTVDPSPCNFCWHGKFAFLFTQTPKYRAKAPLRMYHYIDSFEPYPTDAQIAAMAAEGADMLAVHEQWRVNPRTGGVPVDAKRFCEMIETCHQYGIKVTPYNRGGDESVRDDLSSWFNWYLKKNYDGLYYDGGGQVYECNPMYPGGRYGFKRQYHKFRLLRKEVIGKDGLLTVHTGPSFCGLLLAPDLVDGYTAGEGEDGVMLQSRAKHVYLSEATIAPGALWTAAFPAYKTPRMLPYMANIGQFPHVSLGEQLKTSSLAHTREPGCVTFMRPLWRLYGLMKDERDLYFANDNCDPAFVCADTDTGLSLFGMQDGSKLYILSNFTAEKRRCTTSVVPEMAQGQKCLLCHTDANGCSVTALDGTKPVEAELGAWGICGILVCDDSAKWQERLSVFTAPYPAETAADRAYNDTVRAAASARFDAKPQKEAWLRMSVPFFGTAWEIELWEDLFDLDYALYATDEKGERRQLGWVSKAGLTPERMPKEQCIWPAQCSPWIPLHTLLPDGKWTVELHALRGDADYYSFAEADLAETPDGASRKLVYYGEIDENRSRLTFRVELQR